MSRIIKKTPLNDYASILGFSICNIDHNFKVIFRRKPKSIKTLYKNVQLSEMAEAEAILYRTR